MDKPVSPNNAIGKDNETKKEKKREITSTYNSERLMQLIQEGKNAQEICSELNIKHLQVLKAHVQKLSYEKKTFIEVPGLYSRLTKQAYVNKNGDVKLCTKAIDFSKMKLIPDLTEFTVTVTENQIILQKINNDSNNQSKIINEDS